MEYPRIIAAGDVHRSRNENQQPVVGNSLDKAVFDLKNSVVRLKSDFGDGKPTLGTGFFVNFPSKKYDVILTAAHNLINKNKVEVSNLKVICAREKKDSQKDSQKDAQKDSQKDGEESKKDEEEFEHVVEYKICPKYRELLENGGTPSEMCSHDYGIILLHKDDSKAGNRQGLGLSLRLSSHKFLQNAKEARVSGYGAGDDANTPPKNSSGSLKLGGSQYLEYKAPTEQGMSGSPVWVPYGGHPMVNSDFAKVFLGSKEVALEQDNVTFDIMPAMVFPRWTEKVALYAFKFHKPSTWSDGKKCWVEWQPARQRAILVDILKDVNLVRIQDGMGKSKKRLIILIPVPGDKVQYQELRLYDDERDEDDIEDGMTEFAGVSFGGWGKRRTWLEPGS
ncbi:hypothetical protein TrVFT333_000471 [Trichoderma virens FT-333]|nr:hypothetical protein TrVFT333_000471 [Trichoderma virens FT-333]